MNNKPIIIAHRGASGYLPEHTFAAKAMAHAMGSDFIEQDVALTADGRPIVVHDIFLDTITDVARLFPDRKRGDGRYYAIDFTLKEIKELRVHERTGPETRTAVYPGRFPLGALTPFEVPTLEEEIELILGMNKSTGGNAGIYAELKGPAFHKREGKNIEQAVLDVLTQYGYTSKDSNCFVQCFEPASIIYMRNTLKSRLKMVQLIGDNSWEDTPGVDYKKMLTPSGLDEVAGYADGVGPWMEQIATGEASTGARLTGLVELCHARGLVVHPYTFRCDSLPPYARDFDELLDIFFTRAGVDGIFTDFPDRAVAYLKKTGRR